MLKHYSAGKLDAHTRLNTILPPRLPGSVLFSILLVSPDADCDSSLINTISYRPAHSRGRQSLGPRFFFLGLGFQDAELEDTKKNQDIGRNVLKFHVPKQTILHEFGGKRPKVCITTQKMTSTAGRNRVRILTFIFNFILNSDNLQRRSPLQLNTNGNQECRSRSSTLEMLTRMYDTTGSKYSFLSEHFWGNEQAGYLGKQFLLI